MSVTSAGLIQLDVAGGAGTIVVAEHSAYRGLGVSSGLAETLTGTVANDSDLGNGFGTSDSAQSGTGGSIVLGATANTANGDPQDSNYAAPPRVRGFPAGIARKLDLPFLSRKNRHTCTT